jgi:hypothetical protein
LSGNLVLSRSDLDILCLFALLRAIVSYELILSRSDSGIVAIATIVIVLSRSDYGIVDFGISKNRFSQNRYAVQLPFAKLFATIP